MLQREIGKTFTAGEIKLSKIIASHLAVMIENARLMNFPGAPQGLRHGKLKTGNG